MRRFAVLLSFILSLFVASAANAQAFDSGAKRFGAQGNYNPAPTSGTLTGRYDTSADWVQTGPIICNSCRLFFGGNVTFNNTITVSSGIEGNSGGNGRIGVSDGAGNPALSFQIYASGRGPGGGGGYHSYSNVPYYAGGGGHGGAGGDGGEAGSGGVAYPLELFLPGSGGGITGSNGGGGFYTEARGTVTLTSACAIHADGVAGTQAGGAGGGVDLRALGAITIQSGAIITADGATATQGGGGGGGIINVQSPAGVTNSTSSGNIHANGGTGSTGSSHTGGAGIVSIGGTFTGPRVGF